MTDNVFKYVTESDIALRHTVETNPCFRNEGKTGKERKLVILKDTPLNNHINGELSTRPSH